MSAYAELAHLVTFRPLQQPLRTGVARRAPFSASWSSTVSLLARELRAHGARLTVLEIDLRESQIRVDGLPRQDARADSPGVALSFKATAVAGQPALRYEVGTFYGWQDNVRAIALGLESLRAVDRHGVTKRGEQYAGWKALPAGADDGPNADRGAELVQRHGDLKNALRATHPDLGGDPKDFRDLQAYRDRSGS